MRFETSGSFHTRSGLVVCCHCSFEWKAALRRGPSFSAQVFARQSLTAIMLFASAVSAASQGIDAADETRAISRQVTTLMNARSFNEAETLANKGLALCENAAGVRGFCLGQFNDSLGDIAYLQAQFSSSLLFYQRAVDARAGIDGTDALTLASQLRLGRTYFALHRFDEAEPS
jgi:hypothetical protein